MPVTLDAVAKIAANLPDAVIGERMGQPTWSVGKKAFMWERGFSKADLKRFGDETPPDGPLIAVVTQDLHAKEAVLAQNLPGFFTIPHFDGYAMFLIQLKKARAADVREAINEAYFSAQKKSPRR